jgi:O-antigen ligase
MTWILIAALPALAAILLWAIVDLSGFVLFGVLGAVILPASIVQPGGTNVAAADVLLLIALAAWLVTNTLRVSPDPWLHGNRMLPPAVLFIAANAASIGWSVSPRTTVTFVMQLIWLIVIFPVAFATLAVSIAKIRQSLMFLVGLTCVMAVTAAVVFGFHASSGDLQGTYLPGLHKNALGSFVAAGLVIAYAFALSEPKRVLRGVLIFAALVELAGLVASDSRGAMLGALTAITVVSLLMRRRRVLTVVTVTAIAVAFVLTIGLQAAHHADVSGAYDSSVVRQYSFADAIKQIEARPLLGTGGGTYADYIPQLSIGLLDPDNMFLLTWAEIGFLGLAALLFLLLRFGQLCLAVRRLPDSAAVPALAAGGVTLSQFVHSQVDITWTRGTSSLAFAMIGLMLALTRLSENAGPSPMGVPPSSAPEADRQRSPLRLSAGAGGRPVAPGGVPRPSARGRW